MVIYDNRAYFLPSVITKPPIPAAANLWIMSEIPFNIACASPTPIFRLDGSRISMDEGP